MQLPRRALLVGTILLAQVALVALVYPDPARSGFVADPWVYLERLRGGLAPMLVRPVGYHWQPVAYAFIALLRALFGENPGAFQWVNLAQLVCIGFLTYALGRRVTGDAVIGFVASLLYLGSATFYEVAYWPLAGNMHLLGAQLYLVTLLVAWDVGAGRWPRTGPWLLGASALAAVLTHPAMATVVPVAGLTLWLVSREREALPARGRWIAFGALAGVAVAALGQRALAKALATAAVPPPGFDRERCYRIAMAVADMALLRGSTDVSHRLVGFGGALESTAMSIGIALWILVPLAALAFGCRVIRTPGFRVLAAFYALHVFGVGVGAGMPSRQTILAQVPVVLLVAWGLHALAARLERLIASQDATRVVRQLPTLAALLLVIGALPDHRTATRLTHQAGDTTRALSRAVAAAVPRTGPARSVVLVNAPLLLFERGIGTPVLRDGAGQIPRFASQPATAVELRHVPLPAALPHLTEGVPMTLAELRARVRDPNSVVLAFQHPPHLVRRLTRGNVEQVIAGN